MMRSLTVLTLACLATAATVRGFDQNDGRAKPALRQAAKQTDHG